MRAVLSANRGRIVLCGLAIAVIFPAAGQADIELIGTARISGEATDFSGLTDTLEGGTPHNRLGGISAIEYTGENGRYLLLADRGPADGATAYRCRFHEVSLVVDPHGAAPVSAALVATTTFEDESRRSLVGSTAALDENPARVLRFDPEGIRTDRRGRILVCDEYGPSVFEFSTAGRRTRVLSVPSRFRIDHPSAQAAEEAARNASGRQSNGGFEGLAITPDGTRLYASMQRPLIQDSRPGKGAKRVGTNTRIVEFNLAEGTRRELLYALDNTANGVSEILAINSHEFLVLERDGAGGAEAVTKKIFKVDLDGATDITNVEALPADSLPPGVTPARKAPFLDLLNPAYGLAGAEFPEKIEGLAFGPGLADGRRLLIVAVDNDFLPEKPILLHAFAIDRPDLRGFGW